MEVDVEKFLECWLDKLYKSKKNKIELTRKWAQTAPPPEAGVYGFFEEGKLIYGGETGYIPKRMEDLLDTRNHVVRKNIGDRHYSSIEGYCKASSKKKFPDHIEEMVNSHLKDKITVAWLPMKLGRKELEEKIFSIIDPAFILNKRGKRQGKKAKKNKK